LQFAKAGVSVESICTAPEVLMTDGADRREARRFLMSLPMRVLAREAQGRELRGSTRDVSYRGLYFLSETKFEVGSQIDFVLTLPQKVSSSGEVDIRCHGQVVRVDAGANGRAGIAAKIDRYEFLPASATAA
jgi:hypothetical protein